VFGGLAGMCSTTQRYSPRDGSGYAGVQTQMPGLEDCLSTKPGQVSQDLEDDFDAIGIAKCCHCGIKLPADQMSIEKHSSRCSGNVKLGEDAFRWLGSSPEFPGSSGRASATSSGRHASDGETHEGETHDSSGRDMLLDEDSSSFWEAIPAAGPEREDSFRMETSAPESGLNDADWEDDFDAIGIAKCSHCGVKVPLNDDAMEDHLRVCEGEGHKKKLSHPEQRNEGKCCRCNRRISLDVEAIVAHSHVCTALRAEVSPQKVDSNNDWLSQWGFR